MFSDIINETDIDVTEMLNNTAPNAVSDFLASDVLVKPMNEYGKLDINTVRDNLMRLDEVQASDSYAELRSYDKLAADLIVDFYRKKNCFALACYNYCNCDGACKEEAAVAHRQANIALFGEPDRDIFLTLVQDKLAEIKAKELAANEKEQLAVLEELLDELPLGNQIRIPFYPSEDVLKRFSEMTKLFYEPLLRHIPTKEVYTTEECAAIINEILKDELDGYARDWEAVTEPNRLNAAVDHDIKKLLFPENMEYNPEKLRTLIVHELGVHVMRAMSFSDTKLKAFSFGFPGYEETEEGIAKIMEQGISCKFQKSGVAHYISIGFAHIMQYDFRKVFEIQKRLLGLSDGTPELICFNSVQRAFRGTGELSNNKDLVYFNGSLRVWKYVAENLESPTLFDDLLLSAKTDFLSPLQRELVYEEKAGREVFF